MLTLTLLRHAKSDWDDSKLADFDRPLAERGLKDAPIMGRAMAANGIAPDLVLCSPAVRTTETWALASEELTAVPETHFEEALYHARPLVLLQRLRAVPNTARHVMLVGHNPGFHAFAAQLVGSGPVKLVEAMKSKYPTAGVANIELDVASWSDLAWGDGRLEQFLTPKTVK